MKRKIPVLDKPYRKHRPLTREEAEVWRQEVEGERKKRLSKAPLASVKVKSVPINLTPLVAAKSKIKKKPEIVPQAITKTAVQQLKRGTVKIEARLDLHGHTRETAYNALLRFVADAEAHGLRMTLIITGKGRTGGKGTLRELLPRWLAESPFRERIVEYGPAALAHGGEGAWYVRLRKTRGE